MAALLFEDASAAVISPRDMSYFMGHEGLEPVHSCPEYIPYKCETKGDRPSVREVRAVMEVSSTQYCTYQYGHVGYEGHSDAMNIVPLRLRLRLRERSLSERSGTSQDMTGGLETW